MTQVNIDAYEKQRRMHDQESKLRENAKVRELVKGDAPKPNNTAVFKGPNRDEVENMIRRKLEERRGEIRQGNPVQQQPKQPLDKKVVKSAVDIIANAASQPIRPDLQEKLRNNIKEDAALMDSFEELVQQYLPSGFGNIWIKTGVQYGSVYMATLNGTVKKEKKDKKDKKDEMHEEDTVAPEEEHIVNMRKKSFDDNYKQVYK